MKRIRQTSIDCYRQIQAEGLLSKRRWEIYNILYHHGPMSSNETFDYSQLKGVDGYRHNANARMTELRDLGVVMELGTKVCSKTGRTVIEWDVTDRLPKRLIKPTKKDRVEKALVMLRFLYKHKDLAVDKTWKEAAQLIKEI